MQDGNAYDVIFFDVRDTLGEVDRPGHLVPYRPSTEKLLSACRAAGLRIGAITNLPENVSDAQGRAMVTDALLSESNGTQVKIGDFIAAEAIVTNHEAGADKPDPEIYRFAANKLGIPAERCMFCGENLIEVLAARAAGMQTQLKPCPPGREFLPAPITGLRGTATDSGRAFEQFFEHEHLLGDRIFACGDEIARRLRSLGPGDEIPPAVYAAMAILVYLGLNFADQAHLMAEEAVIPLAVARGMDPNKVRWVYHHHEQARNYFAALSISWQRIGDGEAIDMPYAIDAFASACEGFVKLLTHHAERENDELYPEMGRHFSDMDDTLIINMISHIGPTDFTPYIGLVAQMEASLGIGAAAAA